MSFQNSKRSGVVIAGTHSGSGKTTVTLGLMAALVQRGLGVQPFKCGPDFIDPTLHHLATGHVSRNLDVWMSGAPFVQDCFHRQAKNADIAVVEGVMGCFDGGQSSSAALAKTLQLSVVLVVDVRSMAESVAALVKGFEELDPQLRLVGVIFNRVGSPRHLQLLAGALKEHCQAELLGYLPRDTEFTIPDRHLGLHMGEEAPISPEALVKLADTVSEYINLDRLCELACGQVEYEPVAPAAVASDKKPVRIGVARDRAFCFYYEDNLDILRQAGAELVEFSPLLDEDLPHGLDGMYLGGGYPELYAAQLAANSSMRAAIRNWSESGRPLYSECGGFMYLTDCIVDLDGDEHSMCGVYPVKARMKKGRSSLGYRQATLAGNTIFGEAGTVLRGHEFHYSTIDPMPESVERAYRLADGSAEGYQINNTLGGYLHLHFGFNFEAVQKFVELCGRW